jgi:hypothetical protein
VGRGGLFGRALHAEARGEATRFVVDHDGIPPEWEEHIATGYPTFYHGPLAKYFAAYRLLSEPAPS